MSRPCDGCGALADRQYIIPGTGDKEGAIPEQYYSTKDESSFTEFLKQTDVLVASLPNTANTAYLLNAEKLGTSNSVRSS